MLQFYKISKTSLKEIMEFVFKTLEIVNILT